MQIVYRILAGAVFLIACLFFGVMVAIATFNQGPRPGTVKDEAARAGLDANSFSAPDAHAVDDQYFDAMDGGRQFTAEAKRGRTSGHRIASCCSSWMQATVLPARRWVTMQAKRSRRR